VVLNGSVEIAPRLGQADAVCDLVSSGATLAANQLKPVLDIMLQRGGAGRAGAAVRATCARNWHDLLLRRMDGVLRIRDSKLLMFQAPRDAVD
jgi:ATP phosphoribosyltransferase